MKKRLGKLNFYKYFISARPIFILAFVFLLAVFIYHMQEPKKANADVFMYNEDFSTTTYEDTANTTGIWDTAAMQSNLLNHQWVNPDEETLGNTNFSNQNLPLAWYQQMVLDNNDTPYITWAAYDYGVGRALVYITKWINGTGWTKMNGSVGKDTLSGNPLYSNESPVLHLNSLQKPYLVYLNGIVDYFTRWSGSSWVKMDGSAGQDLLDGGQVLPRFDLDSADSPYVVSYGTNDVSFTKWTPSVSDWTHMDGTTLGAENIAEPLTVGAIVAPDIVIKNDIPFVVFVGSLSGFNDIYFTKWTTGLTPAICGGTATSCWTNMAGTIKGPENISNSGDGIFYGQATYNKIKLDSFGNPYIVWIDESSGNKEIFFTHWSGSAWTKMDGTPGGENLSNSAGESKNPALILDNANNPYVVWEDLTTGNNDIYFSKWNGVAWTGMGGAPSYDNLSNNLTNSGFPTVTFNSLSEPYVIWKDSTSIQLTKWNSTLNAWTDVYNNPGSSSPAGADVSSSFSIYVYGDQIVIDSHDNPNVIYRKNNDFYFTKFLTNYAHTSKIQSLNINSSSNYVYSAYLSPTATLNGQTILYYLSNDGGTTWEPITPNSWHSFTTVGNDLRWRAVLSTSDTTLTPVLSNLSVQYQTKMLTCGLSPVNTTVGGTITVTASMNFTPVAGSVIAEFEQNGSNYANVTLNFDGTSYTGNIVTDLNHPGQNDVAIFATDSATGKTFTCNISDGSTWVKKSISDIPWHKRRGHRVVSFMGKMWLTGGYLGYSSNNQSYVGNHNEAADVWNSIDGQNWTLVTDAAPWSGRYLHGLVVYQNQLWLMGGFTEGGLVNDVWSSPDGIEWTRQADAPWVPRYGFELNVFDNKLWLTGGCDVATSSGGCANAVNDVWYFDGANWTQSGVVPGWAPRELHNVVVFDEDGSGPEPQKMWLMGGVKPQATTTTYNDIWSSADGINWASEGTAAWPVRYGFEAQVFNNQIYVMGGRDTAGTPNNYNDIWSSTDGTTWSLVIDPADTNPFTLSQPSTWQNWLPRYSFQSLVFDDGGGEKLWIMAGTPGGSSLYKDEWYSSDASTWHLVGTNYDAPFRPRFNTPMVAFDPDGSGPLPEKLWVFGGLISGTGMVSDAWSSTDGINWTCEAGNYTIGNEGISCNNPAPGWSARYAHKVVVMNNKLWLIGGCTSSSITNCSGGRKNDVWSSTDGINWTQITPAAAWSDLYDPSVEAFNGKIFVMGGINSAGAYQKNIWYSSDGSTWTGPLSPPWTGRGGAGSLVFNNKLWIAGGNRLGAPYRFNDVWYSDDPTIAGNWTQTTASAGWSPRFGFGFLAYNDKMWVFTGNIGTAALYGWVPTDVWSSSDGATRISERDLSDSRQIAQLLKLPK